MGNDPRGALSTGRGNAPMSSMVNSIMCGLWAIERYAHDHTTVRGDFEARRDFEGKAVALPNDFIGAAQARLRALAPGYWFPGGSFPGQYRC